MILVDSHCHLDFPELQQDLSAVLARAQAAGVGYMQTICTKLTAASSIQQIAAPYQHIFCSVGLHPLEIGEEPPAQTDVLLQLSAHPKVIGLGETGLDYHYSQDPAQHQLQQASFVAHIAAAQQSGLPLIIHTRDAEADTLQILQQHLAQRPFTGVMHCFTGSYDFAMKCLELGFYLSVSGIITFKNAEEVRKVFSAAPLNRMLVETDSPYLAPVPHRGKPNEPSYVRYVAECLAELRGAPLETIAKATTDNFFSLFKRAKPIGEVCVYV